MGNETPKRAEDVAVRSRERREEAVSVRTVDAERSAPAGAGELVEASSRPDLGASGAVVGPGALHINRSFRFIAYDEWEWHAAA